MKSRNYRRTKNGTLKRNKTIGGNIAKDIIKKINTMTKSNVKHIKPILNKIEENMEELYEKQNIINNTDNRKKIKEETDELKEEIKEETIELKEEIKENIKETQEYAENIVNTYNDLNQYNELNNELLKNIISSLETLIIKLNKIYDSIYKVNDKLSEKLKLYIEQIIIDKNNYIDDLNNQFGGIDLNSIFGIYKDQRNFNIMRNNGDPKLHIKVISKRIKTYIKIKQYIQVLMEIPGFIYYYFLCITIF